MEDEKLLQRRDVPRIESHSLWSLIEEAEHLLADRAGIEEAPEPSVAVEVHVGVIVGGCEQRQHPHRRPKRQSFDKPDRVAKVSLG